MTNEAILKDLVEVYRTILANTQDKLAKNGAKLCSYCKGQGFLNYWKDSCGNIYMSNSEYECHNCDGAGYESKIHK